MANKIIKVLINNKMMMIEENVYNDILIELKNKYIKKSKVKEILSECEKKDKENEKLGLEIPHWISVGEIGILNKLLEDDDK